MDEYDFSSLKSLNQAYDPSFMNTFIVRGREAGYNDMQIAAMLANSMYESGHNPAASNKGTYNGLFQWHKSQSSNFKLGDTDSQINYILTDANRGRWPQKGDNWNGWNPVHYKVWSNPRSTIDQISNSFELGYERRGKTDVNRRRAAAIIYGVISGRRN